MDWLRLIGLLSFLWRLARQSTFPACVSSVAWVSKRNPLKLQIRAQKKDTNPGREDRRVRASSNSIPSCLRLLKGDQRWQTVITTLFPTINRFCQWNVMKLWKRSKWRRVLLFGKPSQSKVHACAWVCDTAHEHATHEDHKLRLSRPTSDLEKRNFLSGRAVSVTERLLLSAASNSSMSAAFDRLKLSCGKPENQE